MFWSKKKPPQNVTEQSVQSPRTRFNPNWKFTYERKRLPGPGAQNYAYENYGLPEFSPIGPAVHNRLRIMPLQPPAFYSSLTYWQQGIGGLVQGQIYGQPLTVPEGAQSDGLYA